MLFTVRSLISWNQGGKRIRNRSDTRTSRLVSHRVPAPSLSFSPSRVENVPSPSPFRSLEFERSNPRFVLPPRSCCSLLRGGPPTSQEASVKLATMTNEGNRIHLEIDSTKNPPFHSPPSFKFAVHVPRSLDPPFFSSSRIREEGGDLDFAKFPLPFERNPDKIRPRRSTTEFPECSIQQSRVATWQFPAVGCRDDPSVIDHRRESGVSRCIRNLVHVPIRSEFRRRHARGG